MPHIVANADAQTGGNRIFFFNWKTVASCTKGDHLQDGHPRMIVAYDNGQVIFVEQSKQMALVAWIFFFLRRGFPGKIFNMLASQKVS